MSSLKFSNKKGNSKDFVAVSVYLSNNTTFSVYDKFLKAFKILVSFLFYYRFTYTFIKPHGIYIFFFCIKVGYIVCSKMFFRPWR